MTGDPTPMVQQHAASQEQLQAWKHDVWRYDYFAVMRRLEACQPSFARWGKAALPRAESVRVGQEPSLSFAPAALSSIEDATSKRPAVLRQRFFGYIGPNGPLPIHLSDFIRERALHHNDRAWLSFLDSLSHRFALHFYRAWAQARPAVAMDRPDDDSFRRYVGSLLGMGTPARQKRDAVHDDARLHFSGWLARQVRCRESVESVLAGYFQVLIRVESWVGHWMPLDKADMLRLGAASAYPVRLGQGTVIGARVWDRQHRLRVHIGPLTLQQYLDFLPGAHAHRVLACWMAQLLGHEYEWDAKLILKAPEVPQAVLSSQPLKPSRLGWTSWLGGKTRRDDAQDVHIRG